MTLSKIGIHALSARRNDLVNTVKTLQLSAIKPVIKTPKGVTGGLEDIGNFAEGFCLKVNAMSEKEISWIMCLSSLP